MLNEEENVIEKIKFDGVVIRNKQEIANGLNDFFGKKVEGINKSMPFITYNNLVQNSNIFSKFEFINL